ncbi:unnamed protein product [marine sediment metagenome]|uniref:Uncharacterized protein n=1 Tax=marine sediment metagenome TaxID=412755 RepID=X1SMA7_9ZZZZ
MINFTLKGKNFPTRAYYWGPNAYHIVNGEWVYFTPVGIDLTTGLLVTEIAQYEGVPEVLGFMVFFRDAAGEQVIGPYGGASTSLFPIKDKGSYILDFHGEVGIPTLLEEEEEEVLPEFLKWLIPWSPLFGPPVPKLLPPWPWWFSRWEEGWEESPPW